MNSWRRSRSLLRRRYQHIRLTKLPSTPCSITRSTPASPPAPCRIVFIDIDHSAPTTRSTVILPATGCCGNLLASFKRRRRPGEICAHSDPTISSLDGSGRDGRVLRLVGRAVPVRTPEMAPAGGPERGWLQVQDRRGQITRCDLMTLSMAVVSNEKRHLDGYVQVGELLAELMRHAKSQSGNRWVVDRRTS